MTTGGEAESAKLSRGEVEHLWSVITHLAAGTADHTAALSRAHTVLSEVGGLVGGLVGTEQGTHCSVTGRWVGRWVGGWVGRWAGRWAGRH